MYSFSSSTCPNSELGALGCSCPDHDMEQTRVTCAVQFISCPSSFSRLAAVLKGDKWRLMSRVVGLSQDPRHPRASENCSHHGPVILSCRNAAKEFLASPHHICAHNSSPHACFPRAFPLHNERRRQGGCATPRGSRELGAPAWGQSSMLHPPYAHFCECKVKKVKITKETCPM